MPIFYKLLSAITVAGVLAAIVSGILFLIKLPIFDEIDLAWIFVIGLLSAAGAVFSMAVKNIWEHH